MFTFLVKFLSAKPRIVQPPGDVIVKEGSPAKFVCNATGDPQPTVIWEKQGKGSSSMFPAMNYYGGRFSVSSYGLSLDISRVEKQDEGVYTCWALIPGVTISADATLTVIGTSMI